MGGQGQQPVVGGLDVLSLVCSLVFVGEPFFESITLPADAASPSCLFPRVCWGTIF